MKSIVLASVLFALVFCIPMLAQQAPGVPVSVIITAEAKHGNTTPELKESELHVREAGADRQIESLSRLGSDSTVQLMLLFDNSGGTNFDVQLAAIKKWINDLPPNVEVGAGYMLNGLTRISHALSTDHAAVANSLRVALGSGGADVSPYDSLSDAVKHWPKREGVRREVVMVTSGIEGLGGGYAPQNQYVNAAISTAQREGVIVYGIYNPSAGHWSHTLWLTTMGQNLLSQLCDETGGEAYITTLTAPVSFDSFLSDIRSRFDRQYRLTFLAEAENKSGLQPLRVSARDDNVDVTGPAAVFVKASK
jgi:hypothetical protein